MQSGIIAFTWCAGFTPGNCDVFSAIEVDGNTTQGAMRVTVPLHGRKVYAMVVATNGAGLGLSAVSDGVTYDNLAPSRGSIELLDANLQPLPLVAASPPFIEPGASAIKLAAT